MLSNDGVAMILLVFAYAAKVKSRPAVLDADSGRLHQFKPLISRRVSTLHCLTIHVSIQVALANELPSVVLRGS